MRNTIQIRSNPVGDAVFNASRQVWLASLGAAVVTREWAQADAGKMFRNLVKEGTAVESRTFRLVGDRIETSFTRANTLWRQTRRTVSTRVRKVADSAVTLVQENLPKVTLPAMLMPAKAPAKKRAAPKRAPKARTAKTAKTAKRTTRARKAATK